jgi:DNA-binding transcriptional ArsR family regulator
MWPEPIGGAPAFAALLVGDRHGAFAEAVALAGGRVAGEADWGGEPGHAPGALLALDATDVEPDLLEAELPDLTSRADIVCCSLAELDQVAGALLFTDAQLLCEPSMAERVAAFAVAAHGVEAEAAVREGEAARLKRLSGEVARIAGVLARLAAEEGGAEIADRRPSFDAGAVEVAVAPQAIRAAIRARRLRDGLFPGGLFEDPAWDMLLDLFAAELEGGRVSVSSLCIAAAVAPTTALRWIGRLAAEGLVERRPDPRDKRRAFVALSPQGSAAMRGYVAALERAGLTLG